MVLVQQLPLCNLQRVNHACRSPTKSCSAQMTGAERSWPVSDGSKKVFTYGRPSGLALEQCQKLLDWSKAPQCLAAYRCWLVPYRSPPNQLASSDGTASGEQLLVGFVLAHLI